MKLSSLIQSISAIRAVRSVFPFLLQDKSKRRKICLEAQETPIDVVIPLHKSTCQGINVNNACVAEETSVFEIALATDMSSIGTEMSATKGFPTTNQTLMNNLSQDG